MYDFPIFLSEDTVPGFTVSCRDLPEFNSFGGTEAEALAQAGDAIDTTLAVYVSQRRAIPEASPAKPGEHTLKLPALTVAKIILWNEMVARGMRKADLCRLLDIGQTQGDRLIDFLHSSKIELIEAALAKLCGKRLMLVIE